MTKNSDNILFDVQEQICGILNSDSSISAIGFLSENRKDIDFEIKKHLNQQGICGIVMTPSVRFQGKYSDNELVWCLDDLTVQIVENVPVSRAINSKLDVTGQDAAMKVMDILGRDNYGQFSPVSYKQGEDAGLLVNQCVFKCMVHNDTTPPPPTPIWGEGSYQVTDDSKFIVFYATWDGSKYFQFMPPNVSINVDFDLVTEGIGANFYKGTFDQSKMEQTIEVTNPSDPTDKHNLKLVWMNESSQE